MRTKLLSLAGGLVGLALWTAACSQADAGPWFTEVPADEVCMVQKYFMGPAKMTPVALAGKTYWVCCQGCYDSLKKFPDKERFSTDPVSGKTVDKADAVLGRARNGQIHFFENEANRAAFQPTPTPRPS
jgi:YHS domain-containing protein